MAYAKEGFVFEKFFRAHFVQYNAVRLYWFFEDILRDSLRFLNWKPTPEECIHFGLIPTNRFLNHARHVFNKGDYHLATVIALVVFEQVTQFKQMDYGRPHDESAACVTEAYTLLKSISELDLPREIRLEVFEEILASAGDTHYLCDIEEDYKKLLTAMANEPMLVEAIELMEAKMIWVTRSRTDSTPTNWRRYFDV
jgi:hypothetical protein